MPLEIRINIQSATDIVNARQAGREMAAEAGFSTVDLTVIATAISEIARNILIYAKQGEIFLQRLHKEQRNGILVIARDNGPGIRDIPQAMQDGYTTAKGLGIGLPGTRRLMDEFEITSKPGAGTTIIMRKWVR